MFCFLYIRHNPPGSASGRKFGEASQRLVSNSLQLKVDHNGFSNNMQAPQPSYATSSYIPPANSYGNHGFRNQGQPRMLPSGRDYSNAGYPLSHNPPLRPPYAHSHNEPYGSPRQYQINNQAAAADLHYLPGHHQNGGSRHMHKPMEQMSTGVGPYPSHPGGYDANQRYQAPGNGSYQQWSGRMAPQANQYISGGYGLHQQGGVNQGFHRGHDYQQQRGNQFHHHHRGDFEQRGSQPHRGNQQYGRNQQHRGNQQQRGNPYSALDRKRH